MGKAPGDCRTPGRFAHPGAVACASVLECGGPPPLWNGPPRSSTARPKCVHCLNEGRARRDLPVFSGVTHEQTIAGNACADVKTDVKTACGRRAACYFATVLQHTRCLISYRTRQRLFLAAGVVSLAVWLFMVTAEVYTPLHAWLHGGTIPDNDNCAIAAIAHGKVETVACAAPAVIPLLGIEIAPRIENSVFCPSTVVLPDGRGPPASSFHS